MNLILVVEGLSHSSHRISRIISIEKNNRKQIRLILRSNPINTQYHIVCIYSQERFNFLSFSAQSVRYSQGLRCLRRHHRAAQGGGAYGVGTEDEWDQGEGAGNSE